MSQSNVLFHWQTPEFESRTIGRAFYIWTGIILLAIIIYALATNSPIMAITFILIGIMGFITLEQAPAILHCAITEDGVIVNKELYAFENIESFWIVYEEDEKYLSLKTNGKLIPFVNIPFDDEDPNTLHEILSVYLKEEKHDPTLIDTIEKMLHIR